MRKLLGLVSVVAACGGGKSSDAPDAAPQPSKITITAFKDGTQQNVSLVAFQDGDGVWQEATGAGGLYTFDVVGPRYAVEWVCGFATFTTTRIGYAWKLTTADATRLYADCRASVGPDSSLGGALANVPSADTATLIGGDCTDPTGNCFYGTYSSTTGRYSGQVMHGMYDIIASDSLGSSFDRVARKTANVNGATTLDFDMATDGFALEKHNGTITSSAARRRRCRAPGSRRSARP
jgi:hypothetical protein